MKKTKKAYLLLGQPLILKNTNMGKTYTNMKGKPDEVVIDERFNTNNICVINGTYCLKGCNFIETEICTKHELRKQQLKEEKNNGS
jgi:hypothetical protein